MIGPDEDHDRQRAPTRDGYRSPRLAEVAVSVTGRHYPRPGSARTTMAALERPGASDGVRSNLRSNPRGWTGMHDSELVRTARPGIPYGSGLSRTRRHEAERAAPAHNPKVAGSNPAPATICSVKAQVSDLGLPRWWALLPGSGGLPPAFYRVRDGRWNGLCEALVGPCGVGLHAGQHVLVGLGVPEPFPDDLDGERLL